MPIIKLELVEGEEITYKNPYGVRVAIGAGIKAIKVNNPLDTCFILRPDETINIHAPFLYIRTLET